VPTVPPHQTFSAVLSLSPPLTVVCVSVVWRADSTVHIIAEEVVPVEDLDVAAARAGLEAATAKLTSADPLEKAEAEINVQVHTAMVKALE
jgi:F0F1-type ATP synthase epsilon subunit